MSDNLCVYLHEERVTLLQTSGQKTAWLLVPDIDKWETAICGGELKDDDDGEEEGLEQGAYKDQQRSRQHRQETG